ncbi:MAG: UDP-N-acetylmuramoyl-L-alanine--D-glutamate ligase [Cyanobacteria bacterium CRU_2_1]|nr:UDP-N-acetylmuramoyl-L-alanine--D-glutamate ligase [Cyanobacteria bacterium RU_5_0]NJR58403.1 UDP-N-acetylmuramoyl-L-alanine--D-glutamate ligase [Cyanobacteria bacterium CRU_2_1]
MRNAYVIGLGKSGIAAARLLNRQGWQVTVSDRNHSPSLDETQQVLESEGISVKLGHSFEPDSTVMQRIVVSPGVPWDLAGLIKARELGIETMGEMELAWRSLQSYPWVCITGTNGKTTTTALIAAIFQSAGFNAPACGNIGYAACDLALEALSISPADTEHSKLRTQNSELRTQNLPLLDWVLAELSSYQIEASPSISPTIGVWTTFTPDHLSRHKTLENYYTIKAHLLNQSEHQVLNGDDPYLRQMGQEHWHQACWTSVTGKAALLGDPECGAYLEDGWAIVQGEAIVQGADLRMVGVHNQQNLLMAVLAARLAGIGQEAIVHAIRTFPGVPHRLEHICTWNRIDFINDSKATNYDAAQVGLSSVNAPAILIAGGEAKAGDDTRWLETIQAKAAAVLLIGSAAPAFAQRLQQINYSAYEIVETMDRAVVRGAELGQLLNANVVLLSPACASFDQYQNFEQRGDHFRQLCQTLSCCKFSGD